MARWAALGSVLLIVVIGWAAYINSFQVPFVYDDLGNIVTNRDLQAFKFSEVSSYMGTRSLPQAILALNYRVGQLNVFGYHLVNWLIHVLSALVLFWLSLAIARICYKHVRTYRLAGLTWDTHIVFALFVSLVFVSHPLTTEAVTYVVQRIVSLTVLLYLLAIATYAQWRQSDKSWRWLWAVLSLATTLLAMHSKEIAFTIPLAIIWLELCFFLPQETTVAEGGHRKRRVLARLLFLLPWLVFLLYLPWRIYGYLIISSVGSAMPADVTGSVDAAAAVSSGLTPLSRAVYLMTQFGVLLTYLRLLIFPVGQSIDHDYVIHYSLFDVPSLAGLLVVAGLLALTLWLWPRRRVMSFGIGFFLLNMVMESSILPLLEVVAEYRLYLPLVGFALVAADMLIFLHTKIIRLKILQAAEVVIILLLAVLTFQRNNIWRDPISLWQDAIAKAPEKARPHNNLGTLLLEQGRYMEAASHFQQAVEIDPAYAHAHNNLGTAFGMMGRLEEAATEYQRVLELNPNIMTASINLGIVYLKQEQLDKAEGQLEKAASQLESVVQRDPRSARARAILGTVYAQQGKLEAAREQFEKVLEIDSNDSGARNNLDLVRAMLSR